MERALTSALQHERKTKRKTRRRKGSLRNNVLLGTERSHAEREERLTELTESVGVGEGNGYEEDCDYRDDGGSAATTTTTAKKSETDDEGDSNIAIIGSNMNETPDRDSGADTLRLPPTSRFGDDPTSTQTYDGDDDRPDGISSAWRHVPGPEQRQQQHNSLENYSTSFAPDSQLHSVGSSAQGDATTDDDELPSLPRLCASHSRLSSQTSNSSISSSQLISPSQRFSTLAPITPSGSDSYTRRYVEKAMPARPRASVSQRVRSPLATNTAELPAGPDDWDYSETEWWGWIILIVTWLVFVVGMGSSLGVWSWAWDVGETPYAPPELEDDITLPIVGYYPALIILTAVMAWVWVVVAWVGMKYFRHANISGDDFDD